MLENWLKPLNPELLHEKDRKKKYDYHFQFYTDKFPNLKKTHIAIIGIGEEEANAVRNTFYQLSFPFPKIKVADLGNIRKEDSAFMVPVLKELIEGGICPILIGRNGSFVRAQFQAHQSCQHSVNVVEVNDKIPFHPKNEHPEENYLNDILNGKNSLFHFSAIGGQSHFIDENVFRFLEKSHFDYIRLGMAKADLPEVEPFVRDADMLSIHLGALKHSDAPGTKNASPSGFFSEDACQISRYAGMSDKLTSIGFYGFEKKLDPSGLTAQTLAQLTWYFLDGFQNRQKDFPVSMEQLMEYIVDLKDYGHQITFWKSNKTGRWWIQVPVKTKKKQQRHRLIPCSYNDYRQAASEGDLSDRIWNAFRRFQ